MSMGMIRRVNISLAAGLGFVGMVTAVAILTTDHPLRAVLLGVLLIIAAAMAWLLQRVIVRDLRDRAVAEAKLRDSEARFSGILAIAADAIVTTDQTGRIIQVNRWAEAMFGYAAAEIVGRPLDILLPQDKTVIHREHMAHFARSNDTSRRMGGRREVSGRRNNGEEFPAEASISKLSTADGMLFTAVVRDTTEAKQLAHHEHVLAVAGVRLGATLDYEMTLRLVTELPVQAAGDWCLLDVVEETDRGPTPLRRLASPHSEATRDRALRSIEARGLDWDSPSETLDVMRTGETRFHPDIAEDWLEAHAVDAGELDDLRRLGIRSCVTVPLRSRDRMIGALTVGTSVRRMHAADVELTQALAERAALAIDNALLYQRAQHALAARDEVLAVVSHDLRTPASAIAMCARTLLDHPPDAPGERRALYVTILDSSEWMHRLIRDLLDAASIDAGKLAIHLEREPMAPMLTAVAELFRERARAADVALEADVPPNLPLVLADRDRIQQMLGNLLSNALRFTPRAGTITVAAVRGDDGVVLSVSDTGAGISPENLPYLFDRFWQAGRAGVAQGSGLGLAIAKGIVSAHRGRIWVESAIGRGSKFSVFLPGA